METIPIGKAMAAGGQNRGPPQASDLLVSLHHQWSRTANQGGLVRVLAGPLTRYPTGAFFTRPPGMGCGDVSTVGWRAT